MANRAQLAGRIFRKPRTLQLRRAKGELMALDDGLACRPVEGALLVPVVANGIMQGKLVEGGKDGQ